MMTDYGFNTTDFNGFHDGGNTYGFRGFDDCATHKDRSLSCFNEDSSHFSDLDFDLNADHAGFMHRASRDFECNFQMGFSSYGGEAFSFLEKFS